MLSDTNNPFPNSLGPQPNQTTTQTSDQDQDDLDQLEQKDQRHKQQLTRELMLQTSVPSTTSPKQHNQQTSTINKLTESQSDHLKSLIKIIRQGDYKDFLEILESGALKNLLNVFIEGQTALHYSLIYGRSLAWCKQLVLNGANPNLTNYAGWHPIHLAAFNGSSETMRYIIDCSMVDWPTTILSSLPFCLRLPIPLLPETS